MRVPSMRSSGPGVLALLAALAACGQPAGSSGDPGAGEGPPPSILLVSIDTLRADHLGLYGYGRDTTPYLDRLAAECLVFDRAYTTAPWTLIAHMSMMSGLEPAEHGVVDAKKAVSPKVTLVAERLRAAGYRTMGFYFGQWLSSRYGFERGFDVYREHPDAEQAAKHLEVALRDLNPDRPLFLFLHLFDVHTPAFTGGFRGFYDPPPPYDELFQPGAREVLADVPCAPVWRERAGLDPAQTEAMVALYDGGVRYIDAWLERTVEDWRASGLLDRSLLVITADHGESLGSHGQYGTHGGMYEEGLRIPLLVRFPDGHRAGQREGGLVSVVDLAPTLLEAAGLEVEAWRSGRSLRLPTEAGRVLRAERDELVTWIGEDWKLTVSPDGGRAFHLAQDPDELAPIPMGAKEVRSELQALRAAHEALRAARGALPGQALDLGDLDEEARKELRDLGYAGDVGED